MMEMVALTHTFDQGEKVLSVVLTSPQMEAVKLANIPNHESDAACYGRKLVRSIADLHDSYAFEFGSCEVRCAVRPFIRENPIPEAQNHTLHALYQQMLEKANRLSAENIELKNKIATLGRQLADAKESK